jgi:class 3 adenylate cyclase
MALDIGSDLRSRTSDVQYARAGDSHLAYRVITGENGGDNEVVLLTGGTMPMEALFEDRIGVRLLDGLASLGRLLLFDRQGIGLSDAPADWEDSPFQRWSNDIETVVAAVGFERAVLVGNLLTASAIALFCARRPERVRAVALLEPTRPSRAGAPDEWVRQTVSGEFDSVAQLAPSRADEPGFREWFDRAGRSGASPGTAARVYAAPTADDLVAVDDALAAMQSPVLVMRRNSPFRSEYRHVLIQDFPGATYVDIPGTDAHLVGNEVDALLAEITRFVTGEARTPAPERVLAAVLFSDLVASTEHAHAVGDARWKQLLDRHDEVSRACVDRRGGTVVNTTGDGVVATLPSAIGAIRAAHDLRTALEAEGLAVRVGIHVGDIDRRGANISGLGVVTAARVMAFASAGEILVSGTVALAATGEALAFESRGEHALKGLPGTWELYAVSSSS